MLKISSSSYLVLNLRAFLRGFLARSLPFFAAIFLAVVIQGCASTHPYTCDKTRVSGDSPRTLVLMTDFGVADGAVSEMKGVARSTAPDVFVSDLTHEIPPYNIWQGAYRLSQTYRYWPVGTVFVSVVDPGVGSDRKSIAVRTKSGHIFVNPDNGLMTFIEEQAGIDAIVQIDEAKQRLKGSEDSYTFHGRDLYVYVGARLAGGLVKINDLGTSVDVTNPSSLAAGLVRLPYQKAEFVRSRGGGEIRGTIPVLDPNYGNVWTNIPRRLLTEQFKGAQKLRVKIPKIGFNRVLPVTDTFASVRKGEPLVYFNSLMNLAIALNQGDFARRYKVGSGADWVIVISTD